MAVYNKNSLSQISGFDNQIIAGELVYDQATYWNLSFEVDALPMPLTGAVIDAHIIRRQLSNVQDSRTGITFDIANYVPTPIPISLPIVNRNDANGSFTLTIDDGTWNLIGTDPEFNINDNDGIGFSGRIKISFPQTGSTPPNDMIIFLFFIVRSDGVFRP